MSDLLMVVRGGQRPGRPSTNYFSCDPEESLKALISNFEASDHFHHAAERNPSISLSINDLAGLLAASDPVIYASQIAKSARYICASV